jgi:hypothetical protein
VDDNNDNNDYDVRTQNKNNRFTNLVILNREIPAVNERSDDGCKASYLSLGIRYLPFIQ